MFSPDDALGSILVQTPKLGGHVGERSQTVGVEILILLGMETHECNTFHISEIIPAPPFATVHGLPSSESCWTGWCGSPPGWADCRGRSPSVTSRSTMWCSSGPARVRGTQATSEWRDARATRLKVSKAPQIVSTHHLVDGAIEGVILCENEQNNERHVDVMGISVLHMVKDLEDGQDLRGK